IPVRLEFEAPGRIELERASRIEFQGAAHVELELPRWIEIQEVFHTLPLHSPLKDIQSREDKRCVGNPRGYRRTRRSSLTTFRTTCVYVFSTCSIEPSRLMNASSSRVFRNRTTTIESHSPVTS